MAEDHSWPSRDHSVGPPGVDPGTYGLKACMSRVLDALPAQMARGDTRNARYAQSAQEIVSTKHSTRPSAAIRCCLP